jgi:hypothetical protein
VKTASFFTYNGPGRISIARWAPKGFSGLPVYRPLNPEADMLYLKDLAVYRYRYAAILARLNPAETWDRLHDLAGGAEPVLLCWERPPFSARHFCHRRLVAAWLEEWLRVDVPEIGTGLRHPQLDLF